MATGKKLKLVKVGGEIEGVDLSADGKTLYVTSEVASLVRDVDNGLDDDLTVVDVAGAQAIKGIPVERVRHGLVIVE